MMKRIIGFFGAFFFVGGKLHARMIVYVWMSFFVYLDIPCDRLHANDILLDVFEQRESQIMDAEEASPDIERVNENANQGRAFSGR
jgi:hypothetical protein